MSYTAPKKIFMALMFLLPAAIFTWFGSSFVFSASAAELVLFNDDQNFLEMNKELRAKYYEVFKSIPIDNSGENFLIAPTAMAFDQKNSRLLVGDYLEGRIYTYSIDPFGKVSDFGVNFSKERLFGKISDIFVSARQDFAISDSLLHKVMIFNSFGLPKTSFGKLGETYLDFNEPSGITGDGKNIFVTDRYNCRVCVYDSDGNYKYSFGSRGNLRGQLYLPTSIVASDGGELFVCDSGNDRIQVFDTMGVSLRVIGRRGRLDGEFNNPTDICIDSLRNIYVADSLNSRIQKFDRDGNFMCRISHLSSSYLSGDYKPVFYYKMPKNLESNEVSISIGNLASPVRIKVDNERARLYVLDREQKMIYVFDSENFSKGRSLYIAGDYLNSIKYLQESVEQTRNNVNAMFYLGFSYNEIGKFKEAYGCYKEIIDKFPHTEVAKYARYYMKKIIAANDRRNYYFTSDESQNDEPVSDTLTKRFISGSSEEVTIFERKLREINRAKYGIPQQTAELELENIKNAPEKEPKAGKNEENSTGRQ